MAYSELSSMELDKVNWQSLFNLNTIRKAFTYTIIEMFCWNFYFCINKYGLRQA